MAQSIMPIYEGDLSRERRQRTLQVRLQAERARVSPLEEAARLREEALASPYCPADLKQHLIEELVRDDFCLGHGCRARERARQLEEPLRSIYRGGGPVRIPRHPWCETPHHLFYAALSSRGKVAERYLTRFLRAASASRVRPWELNQARQRVLQAFPGRPICPLCFRPDAPTADFHRGICVRCLSHVVHNVTETFKPKACSDDFREEWLSGIRLPDRPRQDPPPPGWSTEAKECLQAGPDSLALYQAVLPRVDPALVVEVPHQPAPEAIGADGCHTQPWLRAVEIAEWLARWRRLPGPVRPLDLLFGLAWTSDSQVRTGLLTNPRLRHRMERLRYQIGYLTTHEVRRLEACLQADPADLFCRAILLVTHDHWGPRLPSGNQQEALRHALWFLEHHPDHPALQLPVFAEQEREWMEFWQRALQKVDLAPDFGRCHWELGKLFRVRNAGLARALMEPLVRSAHDHLEFSELCGKLSDWHAALEHARRGLESRHWEDWTWALNRVCTALYQLEDWEELYQQAEKHWSTGKNWNGRHLQGVAALELGRREEAVAILGEFGGQYFWIRALPRRLWEQGQRQPVVDYFRRQLQSRKGRKRRTVAGLLRQLEAGRTIDWSYDRFLTL